MSDLIDRYLAELRRALWGDPDLKERILWEVEDHLFEGTERERERGAPPEEAQRRVIARFGLPQDVAAWFAAEIAANGGRTMRQKFTERAALVIWFAQAEAARLGESYVGTEHLLLGLVREDNMAVRVLECLGISLGRVRGELERQVKPGDGNLEPEMQITPRSKQAIELAEEEAQAANQDYLGTEHLLLGLIREGNGLGGKVLKLLGADLDRTRKTIQEVRPRYDAIVEAHRRLQEAEAAYRALLAAA
jgi:hypothetical protein